MAVYVAHGGVAVENELFLATIVVRMVFCNSVSSLFSKSGIFTPAEFLQTRRFPWLAVLQQARAGLPAASLQRVDMYTMLYSYTYANTCM